MAELLFEEAKQLILVYRRGVIEGIRKTIEKMPPTSDLK